MTQEETNAETELATGLAKEILRLLKENLELKNDWKLLSGALRIANKEIEDKQAECKSLKRSVKQLEDRNEQLFMRNADLLAEVEVMNVELKRKRNPPPRSEDHKVVYIAGPYRAKDYLTKQENIHAAACMAARVWKLGHVALCPHLNSAHLDEYGDEKLFVDGTLELMRRCDAVLTTFPGASLISEGARGEVLEARRLGIPVFERFEELEEWLKGSE